MDSTPVELAALVIARMAQIQAQLEDLDELEPEVASALAVHLATLDLQIQALELELNALTP